MQLRYSRPVGDARLILNALQEKGRTILLEQRHKAEPDLAWAAASILARAERLLRLKRLSDEIGTTLPQRRITSR